MPQKRLRVLMSFSHDTDQVVQETAGAVIAGLSGNKSFPKPPAEPETLQAKLTEFTAAVTAALGGGLLATAAKDKCRHELVALLRQDALYVQGNSNDELATLLSSGFLAASTSRARAPLSKPVILSIDQGNSTQLFVTGKALRNARSWELRFTAGETAGAAANWQYIRGLTDSRSMPINGLVPGTTYTVQVRALGGSTGYSDWSDAVSHVCY